MNKFKNTTNQNTYLACEDLELAWSLDDVLTFDEMWTNGVSVIDIAKRFKRKQDEVVILVIDRVHKKKIKRRKGGYLGS